MWPSWIYISNKLKLEAGWEREHGHPATGRGRPGNAPAAGRGPSPAKSVIFNRTAAADHCSVSFVSISELVNMSLITFLPSLHRDLLTLSVCWGYRLRMSMLCHGTGPGSAVVRPYFSPSAWRIHFASVCC